MEWRQRCGRVDEERVGGSAVCTVVGVPQDGRQRTSFKALAPSPSGTEKNTQRLENWDGGGPAVPDPLRLYGPLPYLLRSIILFTAPPDSESFEKEDDIGWEHMTAKISAVICSF